MVGGAVVEGLHVASGDVLAVDNAAVLRESGILKVKVTEA
jgi:hypothetical protein